MLTEETWLLIAVLILVAIQLAPWRWSRRPEEDEVAYAYVIEQRRR